MSNELKEALDVQFFQSIVGFKKGHESVGIQVPRNTEQLLALRLSHNKYLKPSSTAVKHNSLIILQQSRNASCKL